MPWQEGVNHQDNDASGSRRWRRDGKSIRTGKVLGYNTAKIERYEATAIGTTEILVRHRKSQQELGHYGVLRPVFLIHPQALMASSACDGGPEKCPFKRRMGRPGWNGGESPVRRCVDAPEALGKASARQTLMRRIQRSCWCWALS